MAEFETVGKLEEVPEGELAAFEVSGKRIAVANAGGALHAFDDTCTHEHCSLSEGDLDETIVTCPCHGSQFDVTTGAVHNPPATEPVSTYRLRVEGDQIQIEV